jgi:hypothetical protein
VAAWRVAGVVLRAGVSAGPGSLLGHPGFEVGHPGGPEVTGATVVHAIYLHRQIIAQRRVDRGETVRRGARCRTMPLRTTKRGWTVKHPRSVTTQPCDLEALRRCSAKGAEGPSLEAFEAVR